MRSVHAKPADDEEQRHPIKDFLLIHCEIELDKSIECHFINKLSAFLPLWRSRVHIHFTLMGECD